MYIIVPEDTLIHFKYRKRVPNGRGGWRYYYDDDAFTKRRRYQKALSEYQKAQSLPNGSQERGAAEQRLVSTASQYHETKLSKIEDKVVDYAYRLYDARQNVSMKVVNTTNSVTNKVKGWLTKVTTTKLSSLFKR